MSVLIIRYKGFFKGLFHTSVVLLLMLVFGFSSQAQSYSVTGTIFNPADQQALPGATTIILSASDSTFVLGTTTDLEGNFTVRSLSSGEYVLQVSYVGHEPMYKSFSIQDRSLGLGMMLLKPAATQLETVEVSANRVMMKQVGDTTVYFASAVHVDENATARQLIDKMPGLRARNGQLQAQGEDILEITVDGKRFFETDLETALKMLPAGSVENVEVFDYQSERAKLTGIDEGGTGKSINIVTKSDFRQRTFGRGYVGGGSDATYQGGGNINVMNNDQRVSVLYQANNINQQNFAQEDVSEISNSGFSEQSGLAKVQAGGIDFSTITEKTEISGTYLVHANNLHGQTELERNFIENTSQNLKYYEDSDEHSKSLTHNLNLRLQHELSDRSSILFQPTFYHNGYESLQNLNTKTIESQQLLSSSASDFSSVGQGTDFTAPVTFSHRFHKPRRTISAEFTPTYNKSRGETWLTSQQWMYNDITELDSTYQQGRNNAESWNFNAGLHYSEPISKKSTVYLHWTGGAALEQSDERVYRNGVSMQEGNQPDSLLSNKFSGTTYRTAVKPEYMFRSGGHQFKIGVEYSFASLSSEQIFPDAYQINRNFTAVLPQASWRINFGKGKRLNLNYHASNRAPSAFQLQTVPDNSNPMRQYAGNENLNQEIRHRISANYITNNFDKGSVFMFGGSLSIVDDFYASTLTTTDRDTLIDNRIFLKRGGQLMRTENMNGFYLLNFFGSMDRDVNFLSSTFSAGVGFSQGRMPGRINEKTTWTDSKSVDLSLGLSSNLSKNVDFDISSKSAYETALYSQRKSDQNHIFRQETGAALKLIWKGFTINTDLRHLMLRSNDEFYNRDILLCNVGIGYQFLKNRQAEFRFTVFDLFNNNTSIRRMISDVYTDNYSSNVLNRYAMLTFTYRLNGNNR